MKVQTLTKLRQYHNYVGLFFAPAIIFFAISGAFQTFRLQDEKGYGGPPPTWLVVMAELHKDQMLPKTDAGEAKQSKSATFSKQLPKKVAKPSTNWSRFTLQIFAVLMALGLIISSTIGIAIALSNRATRKRSYWLLASGLVLPILPLLF